MTFKSMLLTRLAMLRWMNISPGSTPVRASAGMRESEQPVYTMISSNPAEYPSCSEVANRLTDPEVVRRLASTQVLEELGLLLRHLLGPLLVVLEDAVMALLEVLLDLLRSLGILLAGHFLVPVACEEGALCEGSDVLLLQGRRSE